MQGIYFDNNKTYVKPIEHSEFIKGPCKSNKVVTEFTQTPEGIKVKCGNTNDLLNYIKKQIEGVH